MKQVVTKQGKTFDYSEILLFNRVDDKIVVILNDKEQIAKFSLTGNSNDAPIAVIPYSEEEFKEIVSSMKPIAGYTELSTNRLFVEYGDDIKPYNTKVEFDSSNKEIIENNLIEQRKAKERNVVGNWYDAEQNKETSTVITEEQRFKVLQVEKYEEQEKSLKTLIGSRFLAMGCSALAAGSYFANGSIYGAAMFSLASNIWLVQMVLSICKYVNINKDKNDILSELQSMGINFDEINNSKEKGAK